MMSLDAEDTAVETALHRGRDWKGYAAMLMAVVAVISTFRKQPEDAAKAGYIELTTAILASQESERKNHEDLMAMHEYLDSYIKSHESVITPVIPTATAATPPSALVPLQRIPITMSSAAVSVHASAPESAPTPPHIAPLTEPRAPRRVDSISW